MSLEAEQAIREAFEAGNLARAAELTLATYGDELFGFLMARLRSASDAHEVFSMFTEDLWTGLPGFGFRCSVRTWVYILARSATSRYLLGPEAHVRRHEGPSELDALVERARTATHVYQRTTIKDRFRLLREQLDDEDQVLLILRVDRGMAWRDLAIAMSGNAELDEASIDRESMRLRKAFERVKKELRRIATRDGLLGTDDGASQKK
jgi:RNA polymerase sigma-70 factor (ECF subfamily)